MPGCIIPARILRTAAALEPSAASPGGYNAAVTNQLSRLPAVHRVLGTAALVPAVERFGRATVRDAVRSALDEARRQSDQTGTVPDLEAVVARSLAILGRLTATAYPEVINATGVLIHTNLGRAPAIAPPPAGYLALEFDLDIGERGERLAPVVQRLRRYFGAEAATVVTNNAAALVLLLAGHAAGREVIVSRGELIEIGGSFRLPELMRAAGTRLVEVGCTNRTHAADYEAAIGPETAAILSVHRSNFHMQGFVSSPEVSALAEVAHRHSLPLWVDQGSGCHLPLERFSLRHEATVQEILGSGADAVLFSGDKLLGSAQAGILLGTEPTLAPLRRHPLRRALRPDRNALRLLAACLDSYLADAATEVPLYRLLAVPETRLKRRARGLARRLGATAVSTRAVLGGGTTPDQTLASWGVQFEGGAGLAGRLRAGRPPVVARVERDTVMVDLRAVPQEQDRVLGAALAAAQAELPGAVPQSVG